MALLGKALLCRCAGDGALGLTLAVRHGMVEAHHERSSNRHHGYGRSLSAR